VAAGAGGENSLGENEGACEAARFVFRQRGRG